MTSFLIKQQMVMIFVSLVVLITVLDCIGGFDSHGYNNSPVVDNDAPHIDKGVLLDVHKAPLPFAKALSANVADSLKSGDAVIGLMAFGGNYLKGFVRFVGSLRRTGFDGHILLGGTCSVPLSVSLP